MTAPVCHQDIGKEQNFSESRVVVIVTVTSIIIVTVAICQPDRLFATAEVESKITDSIVESFPDDVAVIPRLLADGGKDGEVRGELGVQGVCQWDDSPTVELHCVLLEERRASRHHLSNVVVVVGPVSRERTPAEIR